MYPSSNDTSTLAIANPARLDGRFMSHACTVNSSLCCKVVLVSEIQVEEELLAFLTSSLEEQFINLMRKGIIMYDEVFAPTGSPFLSAVDVVVGMDLHLAIPRHCELGFNTAEKAEEEIAKYLKLASSSANTPLLVVFTSKGKSISVVFMPSGKCLNMDSHAHGQRDGLLASCETVQSNVMD